MRASSTMRATLLLVALTSGCSGLTATGARTPTAGRLLRPHTRATAPSMALAPTLRSAAVVLGAANLAQYHIQLMRSEAAGQPTWRAAQSAARSSWARFVRETSGWLYAIQTLRNAITASTFLASTVLTLFTVTMGYLSNSMSKSFEWLVLLRFSATGFLLLCSSYSFLQSARCRRPIVRHDHLHYHHLGCTHPRRYMTHAGFMFPVARDPGDGNEEICLSDDPDELCLPTPVSEEAPARHSAPMPGLGPVLALLQTTPPRTSGARRVEAEGALRAHAQVGRGRHGQERALPMVGAALPVPRHHRRRLDLRRWAPPLHRTPSPALRRLGSGLPRRERGPVHRNTQPRPTQASSRSWARRSSCATSSLASTGRPHSPRFRPTRVMVAPVMRSERPRPPLLWRRAFTS